MSTCTCMHGLMNLLACMLGDINLALCLHVEVHVIFSLASFSSSMASLTAANVSPVQHPLSVRPSSGLIAFGVVAELGIGIDAAEREDVIGDGSVRPG